MQKFSIHFFCIVWVYNSNRQYYISKGLIAYKPYASNSFNSAISERSLFLNCEAYDYPEWLVMTFWKQPCLNRFSQGDWNCFLNPIFSNFMVNYWLTYSPVLNRCKQTWKKPLLIGRKKTNLKWLGKLRQKFWTCRSSALHSMMICSRMVTIGNY